MMPLGQKRDRCRCLTPDELAIARSVIYASLFDYPLTPASSTRR